jgi:iron complex outermembrane receptor protein
VQIHAARRTSFLFGLWNNDGLGPVVILALGVLCATHQARADEVDPFALSPEQLFNATVTSVSKTAEKLGDAPAAIFVLKNEDIMRSGATTIAEALRLVPGVEVIRASASSWAISVRGFNTGLANKLLVLIDGREVYDPLFSGVYWDVQDTALEDIERIEVIRGPGGTLWGANAVNGVINIITKSAKDTKGALASVIAGDKERAIVTGRYGAQDDNAHWRVYGKYLNHTSTDLPSGIDAQDEWHAWRFGFRTDWDTTPQGDTFTLQGDAYTSDSGKLRSVPQLTAPYATIVEENIAAEGGNILGRWTHDLDDGASLTAQAYVDTTRRQQFTLKDRRTSFDFDLQYDLPDLDRHEIIAGFRYRYTDSRLTETQVITFDSAERHDQLYSGFVQDKITLEPERWFLTIGSKFEHNDYTGFEVQPSARLLWSGDEQAAWAAVSRAVRVPSWLEHDLTAVTGVLPPGSVPGIIWPIKVELQPSPGFESEELVAYELGYRNQVTPNLMLDIAAFYNDYEKLSTLSLMAPTFGFPPLHVVLPVAMTNLTHGETYGFELVGTWRAAPNFNLSAAYSFLEIDLHGPPSSSAISAEIGEQQSPQQQFNLRAQWDVDERLALDSTVYYVDDVPAFALDSYLRWDARIGWRVADTLQLELVGQDLLDETGSDANPLETGRSIFGRLTWRP